jgi:hypothetical protein
MPAIRQRSIAPVPGRLKLLRVRENAVVPIPGSNSLPSCIGMRRASCSASIVRKQQGGTCSTSKSRSQDLAVAIAPYDLLRMDAGHGRWPHAGIDFARHPVGLHYVRTIVETAGFALHDEKPERISRLFDETIADCSFGRGRWACGKCRQCSLKPSSKPSESRCPFLGYFVFEGCPSRTKRTQCHRRAPKHGLSAIP